MSEDLSCIADDDDFASLKRLVDNDDGWSLELCKANTLVWTRSVPGCNFQMVKINSRFEDIEPECVFDVLLDPDYRKEWDSHMLESFDIGNFNVNNDVGYYASKFLWFYFHFDFLRSCWRHPMSINSFFANIFNATQPLNTWVSHTIFSFMIAFEILWFCSVVSTSAEAKRLCFIALMVGYWATWRADATLEIGGAQRFSAEERLRAVSVRRFIQFHHKNVPLNSNDNLSRIH